MVLEVATHGVDLVFKIITEVSLQEKKSPLAVECVLVACRFALWLLFLISNNLKSQLLLGHRRFVRLGSGPVEILLK